MQETQETWVLSPGWDDPLEKEMATDSSILAWKIPWAEEPSGLQSMRLHRFGHHREHAQAHARAHTHTHAHSICLAKGLLPGTLHLWFVSPLPLTPKIIHSMPKTITSRLFIPTLSLNRYQLIYRKNHHTTLLTNDVKH